MDPQSNSPIETIFTPPVEVTDIIERGLHEYNTSILPREIWANYARMAIVSRDENGAINGGLIGIFVWGALKVDVLWVDKTCRGQDTGTRLIRAAEEVARSRGVSLIYLETTSFQARGFYEKNGFTVYGQMDDYPQGHTWYHMKKNI